MDLHALIYICLAAIYLEAAIYGFFERQYHAALRETAIATLYLSIAFAVFDPSFFDFLEPATSEFLFS